MKYKEVTIYGLFYLCFTMRLLFEAVLTHFQYNFFIAKVIILLKFLFIFF